uniref:Group II intron maturase-specific domain protein n=1 Tax=Oedogonium cardiacum TaxID=55995 RepID=B3V4L8_OEDCA|nr:group II intron maturase-specific domain protein [Oedogonium cardiacum]ACC97268.1 group II intron maturase-specific domain protein [Oedogonium cardiacum]
MVTLMKEYLSLLQCLLYKAQKRQKIKQILKFQRILYKSQSIVFFILRNKNFKNNERKKFINFLSEPIFKKFLKMCILKKQIQICYFLNSQLSSRKKLINFKASLQNFSSLFLESKKKKLFYINFISGHHNLKLSYLFFNNNSINWNRNFLGHLKLEFLSRFTYYILLLFLPTHNFLLFDVNNKNKQLSVKKSNISSLQLGMKYSSFNYQTFYNIYLHHHNYYLDSEKIQYQNSFYFHLLSNRKQIFFFNYKQKKRYIKINRFRDNFILNYKNSINKYTNFCYYSMILNNPFFRQNSCFFSFKLVNNSFFNHFNKIEFLEIQLNNFQKQILFFLLEPIWEACFEIASYSNRRGRSLYDVIEFLRFHLKKQPMYLFKIYFHFFNKIIYKKKEKKKNLKYNFILQKKSVVFDKFNSVFNKIKIDSLFFNFMENIIFYGIQKKYQNYYLRTKQQIFLYQILKIIKQNNKKNAIYFYKIFYNKFFFILTIQNPIQKKVEKRKVINNFFIINYKKFIIESCKNSHFNKSINDYNNVRHHSVINLKLETYFINNFLILSLSYFFKEKIKNLKNRLFSIELKKQKFSFYLQKLVSTFFPRNTNLSKTKGISFSIIYKDSNFFVSKNSFLFFFIKKNKKLFLNLLNQWNKENCNFFNKRKNNTLLLKKLQCEINTIHRNQLAHIFIFSKKIYSAQLNFRTLVKINLSFIYGYLNSLNLFLNLDSFNTFTFLLLRKNIYFYATLVKQNSSFKNITFFLLMYYCNLYVKFFSFFTYSFKINFFLFLLEKNDVKLIWNSFIKYKDQIFYFNSNYIFLKSFQTILKKWMILNKTMLFLYMENNKKSNISPVLHFMLYSKSFLLTDSLIYYIKIFLNIMILNLLYLKRFLYNKFNFQKSPLLSTLWSINFFFIKEKHTFLIYKKKINGFGFFNFFMFHSNKKICIANFLFFWQFSFLKILYNFKYIQSFINYFEIYEFIIQNDKILKNKQINQIMRFLFFQYLFLQYNYLIFSEYNNFLEQLINFYFKNKFINLHLFKFIFYKIIKTRSTLIFYNKLIQQQTLKIYFDFSIKPSKYRIERHLFKICNIVKKSHNKTQEYIIFKLSKNIKNWCYYYQIITPTILFKYLDYLTLQILWRWACKRHYQKRKRLIKMKYFYKFNFISPMLNNFALKKNLVTIFLKNKKIVFASQRNLFINLDLKNDQTILFKKISDKKETFSNINQIYKKKFICLPNHSDIILIKHTLLQNDRSPFDGDFIYWIPRNFYD